ncbi:hypothetical protein Tco_1065829 [Tanacetum coccineum]
MWLTSTTGRPPSTEEHHNEKLLEGDLHCEIKFDYTLLHKTSKRNKNLQRLDVDVLHNFYIQANQTQKQRCRTSLAHGRINHLVQEAFHCDAPPAEGGRHSSRWSRC